MGRMIEKVRGETLGVQALFSNLDGVPTDPPIVAAVVRKPDDTTAPVVPVRLDTGKYVAQVDSDQQGVWEIWVRGDNDCVEIKKATFIVSDSPY